MNKPEYMWIVFDKDGKGKGAFSDINIASEFKDSYHPHGYILKYKLVNEEANDVLE